MQKRLEFAWNYVAEATKRNAHKYMDEEAGLIEQQDVTDGECLAGTHINVVDARLMAKAYAKAVSEQAMAAMMKGQEIEDVLAGAFAQGLIIGAVAQKGE